MRPRRQIPGQDYLVEVWYPNPTSSEARRVYCMAEAALEELVSASTRSSNTTNVCRTTGLEVDWVWGRDQRTIEMYSGRS